MVARQNVFPGSKQSHVFYQTRLERPRLTRAEGVYLWDINGKRYLDGCSGAMVSNIGHSNPRVLQAMREQMDKATFGYRLHFENDAAEGLAARVAELSPAPLDQVFYVSGGSEAVESCVKMARQFAIARGEAERYQVISRYPSYHGATLGALALTGYDPLNEPFNAMLREMPKIPAPTCYLDRDELSDEERGLRYANMLAEKIDALGPETVLAFIVEPIGGASTGALVPPDSYLPRIREICDQYGVLLIADEVMTGAGRTGSFLGCDHWHVVPDIVAMAKGFGAGYMPLGAMLTSSAIADTVLDHGGFQHGFTSAGNPLACAAGLAVINEVVERELMQNAVVMGGLLKACLSGLQAEFPMIGDVRGKGLLLAIEIVKDRQTMEPLPAALQAANQLVEIAYELGLIIYARRTRGGFSGDHLMICPPLIATREHVDEIIGKLRESLKIFTARN